MVNFIFLCVTQQNERCDICITLKKNEKCREKDTIKFVSIQSFVVCTILKYMGTFQDKHCDFIRSILHVRQIKFCSKTILDGIDILFKFKKH